MISLDIASTLFARMDARDANGVLALVTPYAKVKKVPLNLQGDAEDVERRYFEQLASAFPVGVRTASTGAWV